MKHGGVLLAAISAILMALLVGQGARLVHLRRAADLLGLAEEHLAAEAIRPALEALASLPQDTLGEAQLRERRHLLVAAVALATRLEHPVASIGPRPFDPTSRLAHRSGESDVVVSARLHPAELEGWVTALRLGEDLVPFRQGMAESTVHLADDGVEVTLLVALVVTLPGDPETVSIAVDPPVRLILDQHRPEADFVSGDGRRRLDGTPETSPVIIVPPFSLPSIEIRDPAGLKEVAWQLGEAGDSHTFSDDTRRDVYSLPIAGTVWRKSGRSTLTLTARNHLGNTLATEVVLDVKDPRWWPVVQVSLGERTLDPNGTTVRQDRHRLVLELEPGTPGDIVALDARLGGPSTVVPLKPLGETRVSAELDLRRPGPHGLLIVRRSHVLATFPLTVDGSAPEVEVLTNDGTSLPPGHHVLRAGTEMMVSLRDPSGLPQTPRLVSTGLDVVSEEPGEGTFTCRLRTREEEDGTLTIDAEDLVGNQAPRQGWTFGVPRPLSLEAVRVDGAAARGDSITLSHDRPVLDLTFRGTGRPDVFVLDASGDTLRKEALQPVPGEVVTHALSLDAPEGESVRWVVIRNQGGDELSRLRFLVDRLPPRLRVVGGTVARDGSGVTWQGPPGERLVVVGEDAGGAVHFHVVGSLIVTPPREVGGSTVVQVAAPEELPTRIRIFARDGAGNESHLEILVMTAVGERVAMRVTADGAVLLEDAPVTLRRPSQVRVELGGASLLSVTLGGVPLTVSPEGQIADPDEVLAPEGALEIRFKTPEGREQTRRYGVTLESFEVPAALRRRLDQARVLRDAGDAEGARQAADSLEEDARRAADRFLIQTEIGPFLVEIRKLREGNGPTPPRPR
jgi:hypothetical protein